jgi:hypothetical protein
MNQQTPSHSVVSVGWRLGVLLGTVHVINHSLEVFGNLQPPLPAIRGVAMWCVMFVVCSAAASSLVGRTRSVRLGTAASVVAAGSGAAILVVYAVGIGVARGEPLAVQTMTLTGGMHLGGSVLVGIVIGLLSGWIAAGLARASRVTAWWAVVGHLILLAAGLLAIAHAGGLERSARPPFIVFGLPAVAIALAVAAPAVWALTRPRR